jgi:hypothetical protein
MIKDFPKSLDMMFFYSKRALFLMLFFGPGFVFAQKTISKIPVNELSLNTSLSQYESDLRLITGYEEIYKNFPNLQENVFKNIDNGVREGLYGGYKYDLVDGIRASRTTFFFFKDELYKIRWFFLRNENPDLEDKVEQLNKFLKEKYGPTTEESFLTLNAWSGKGRYLQTFFDEENEFQIEYRDEKIHKKVEKIKLLKLKALH